VFSDYLAENRPSVNLLLSSTAVSKPYLYQQSAVTASEQTCYNCGGEWNETGRRERAR
jgi:hypothetical protein